MSQLIDSLFILGVLYLTNVSAQAQQILFTIERSLMRIKSFIFFIWTKRDYLKKKMLFR